jgi:hypothetical protein
MDAIVSGHAGVALLLNGGELRSLHYDRPEELIPRRASEVDLLFGGAKDLEVLENVETEQVIRYLDLATERIDALHLALILLDGDLSRETRQQAAMELEELLRQNGMQEQLERILFAQPLPRSADLPEALACCSSGDSTVLCFLQALTKAQGTISEVRLAWEAIPNLAFGSEEERSLAQAVAVREGFFHRLVAQRASGKRIDSAWLEGFENWMTERQEKHGVILREWTTSLRRDPDVVASDSSTEDAHEVQVSIERAYKEIWTVRIKLSNDPELAPVYARSWQKLRRLQAIEAGDIASRHFFPSNGKVLLSWAEGMLRSA